MKDGTSPKERLFASAARLFYQQGYRAVGVDLIAADSGIGKMTLYRHFSSKEDLIIAFLRASNEEFWTHFEYAIREAHAPREQLKAFFVSLQAYTTSAACLGCPFINVITEYPEQESLMHQVAVQHKTTVRERFARIAKEGNIEHSERLADALMLLMDGAYVAARLFGAAENSPAWGVASAARGLIDASSDHSAAWPVGESTHARQ